MNSLEHLAWLNIIVLGFLFGFVFAIAQSLWASAVNALRRKPPA